MPCDALPCVLCKSRDLAHILAAQLSVRLLLQLLQRHPTLRSHSWIFTASVQTVLFSFTMWHNLNFAAYSLCRCDLQPNPVVFRLGAALKGATPAVDNLAALGKQVGAAGCFTPLIKWNDVVMAGLLGCYGFIMARQLLRTAGRCCLPSLPSVHPRT